MTWPADTVICNIVMQISTMRGSVICCNTGFAVIRIYKMLKQDFRPSKYVNNIFINKHRCRAFAKFRCGVAPIRPETGRYENLPEEQRLCPMCDSQAIESDIPCAY